MVILPLMPIRDMRPTKKIALNKPSPVRRGGRPSQAQAARLRDKILDAASDVFFTEGYGAASIEAIARRARIAKRTLYSRFRDKAELFAEVVHHLVENLRPPNTEKLFRGTGADILQQLAEAILHAALNPQAVALHRLILAEATRFPELADVMHKIGAREEAVTRIAGLLEQEARLGKLKLKTEDSAFAAEQFLQMIVGVPQRRAMGLGKPMSPRELDQWAKDTVRLFVNGCRGML
jgi:TetR/AcrR family transcriptional regulator, mexJK operon transcriptional repressor